MAQRIGLLVLIAAVGCSLASETARDETPVVVAEDPHIRAIDDHLIGLEANGMNGVLLIRRKGQVLVRKAYGFRDRETGERLRVDHGFTIGSLVKPLSAVGILALEERGALSTSDTLVRFFPDAPADKRSITIQQLLTHTAGMPDVFGGDFDVVSRDWLVDRALSARLIAKPGEREQYSNSGYSLLAVIAERVTGKSFEAHIRETVLSPAGTTGIGYVLAGWTNDRLAVGYRSGRRWGTLLDRPWADDGPSWNLRGNGGMLGTVDQVARWYEALFAGKILGPAALEKFYAFDAGRTRSGARALGHAGGNGVFNAFQVSFIDEDVHFTFFTSDSRFQAEAIWRDIRDHVLALRPPVEEKARP